MGEQRLAAVAVDREKRFPKLGGLLWQGFGPRPVPSVEFNCQRAVGKARSLRAEPGALEVEFQASILRVAVEYL